ncbi:DUF3488 and transglutaminase-like domain-containing protein [Ferrimonas pelagia]|uniref:DUF3488 and transglutaminase-like domain-containing protein n=1 Tax=Ferrimonas pelagia TaxID=1177826 RepID=A0ABP9FAT5_9GAMM
MLVSRAAQGCLLLSQIAIILPLSPTATPWTLAILLLCLLWRVGIFYGRVTRPPKLLVNSLGIAATLTLFSIATQMDMMQALTNLLILAYGLKTIETRNTGDLTVVILTGYFLIGLHLLDSFTPLMAVQMVLLVALNTTPLLISYRPEAPKALALETAKLMVFSLPLTLLLFLLVPRMAPIWQLQNPQIARTGLSDSLALGQIAQLTRSDELVMRASFDGAIPAPEQRYWRALILNDFDGQRWRASRLAEAEPEPLSPPYRPYQLILEPSHQRWLPTLKHSDSQDPALQPLPGGRLGWRTPPATRTSVALLQAQAAPTPRPLSETVRQQALQLPAQGDPASRRWATQLRQQYDDPTARIAAILQRFRQAPFRYTLQPPKLGPDQIDSFLFDTQAGFCSHYASALVFVARQAGIPARLVTGYQGGELGPRGDFLSIYQYNAHAWSEVWLEGQGWVRIDPTAAVAPERVEQGAQAALAQQEGFMADARLPWLQFRNSPWLWQLRGWMAQVDYQWSRWVMGFDEQRQARLWDRWMGGFDLLKAGALLGGAIFVLALLQALSSGLLKLPKTAPLAVRRYRKILRKLEAIGAGPKPGEAPLGHLRRLQVTQPQLAARFAPICHHFLSLRYDPQCDKRQQMLAMQRAIKRLRRYINRLHSTIPASARGSFPAPPAP